MSQTKEQKDSKEAKDAKGGGKLRVFALASELELDTKTILEFCKELGFTSIKNQLNALEPEQANAIRERAKKGGPKVAAPPPAPPKPVTPPKLDKIPTLAKPKTLPPARPTAPAAPAAAPTAPVPPPPPAPPVVALVVEAPPPVEPPAAEVKPAVVEVPPVVEAPPAPPEPTPTPAAVAPPVEPLAPPEPPAPVTPAAVTPAPEVSAPEAPRPQPETPPAPAPVPNLAASGRVPNLNTRPPNLNTRPPVLGGNRPPQTQPPRPPAAGPVPPATPARPTAGSGPVPPPTRPAGPPMSGGAPPRPAGTPPGAGPRPGAPSHGPGPGGPRPHGGPPARPGAPGGSGPIRAGGLPPRHGPGGGPSRPGQGPGGPGGPGRPGPAPGKPGATSGAPKQVKLTPEQIERLRLLERQRGKVAIQDVHKATAPPTTEPAKPGGPVPPGPGRPGRFPAARPEGGEAEGEEERRGGGPAAKRPGEVAGRDSRHKARQDKGRQHRPATDRGSIVIGAGGQVDIIESQFGSRIKKHRGRQQVVKKPQVSGRVEITLPITVRSLSETIGMKAGELILKLKNLTNSLYTINSNIEFEVAEMVAIDRNIELVPKKQETAEDVVFRELRERAEKSDPANLQPRPPIVTIMGHVDHGKTSLLDRIRQDYGLSSDVVSTEAGGITQVLRAWRVEKDGKATTFLDTPGHEAFTKMRARGANVTDIAVIVVSAADGVMPQTEEAINHAKAAEVDLIVAINKVDLPEANIDRTRRQLYQLGLLPDNMGGDVPFVECSAKTGKGIDDLLNAIATLAELSEPPLLADPTIAGSGTCLEAYLEGEKGVIATLLVRNGTLRKGDVVLCGATFGRVRAMYDDLGRSIEEAGPSVPVKIIGLDEVPDADDPFYVVDEIATAREIAERRKELKQEAALAKFSPVSLDKLKEHTAKAKITELKVILKAEARGSVEAIKKELEKLVHEEVRVRVLHAAIGAITESDVTLALTSPQDTLIVGFNVTADDAALALAEERGISIREYQIIYNLVDDVKAALEGRLKPVEEVVHLGRAVVRETFKISKVGTIAGCYVTSGVIERNARVRLIREGAVLYPQGEKVAGLDSLKRFKDDVREVREGFECGMKITGFDDIKVGDVIEAFRIEIKQRTL